jgi:hypothetical protein
MCIVYSQGFLCADAKPYGALHKADILQMGEYMYRTVINDFVSWYEERKRKILYVKGALGVGKTWAIKDFATGFFESSLYISLISDADVRNIITFQDTDNSLAETIQTNDFPLDDSTIQDGVRQSIKRLDELFSKRYPDINFSKCMLIFDDAEGLSLSDIFFHEYRRVHPDYSLCVSASTMEITPYQYHYKDVFKIIRMRPLSFEEYLIAKKAHPLITAITNNKTTPLKPFEEQSIHDHLKEYLITGGMPEVVNNFIKYKDFSKVRKIQKEIIKQYEQIIFHMLSSALSQRCRRIWRSVPNQLCKDNRKFMYKYVEENARAREYDTATQTLCNLGFVRKLPRLIKPELPLEENADHKSFELFLIDHGLLRAMYDFPASDENVTLTDIFSEGNGAVAEQFIFQELSCRLPFLYYWISGATARIPFVYECDNSAVPVDIQFTPRSKAQSIKVFNKKYKDAGKTDSSLKISLGQISLDKSILNIPVYGLWTLV